MYHYDAMARIAQDRIDDLNTSARRRGARWENRTSARRRRSR